jgi:hypothetical protein
LQQSKADLHRNFVDLGFRLIYSGAISTQHGLVGVSGYWRRGVWVNVEHTTDSKWVTAPHRESHHANIGFMHLSDEQANLQGPPRMSSLCPQILPNGDVAYILDAWSDSYLEFPQYPILKKFLRLDHFSWDYHVEKHLGSGISFHDIISLSDIFTEAPKPVEPYYFWEPLIAPLEQYLRDSVQPAGTYVAPNVLKQDYFGKRYWTKFGTAALGCATHCSLDDAVAQFRWQRQVIDLMLRHGCTMFERDARLFQINKTVAGRRTEPNLGFHGCRGGIADGHFYMWEDVSGAIIHSEPLDCPRRFWFQLKHYLCLQKNMPSYKPEKHRK